MSIVRLLALLLVLPAVCAAYAAEYDSPARLSSRDPNYEKGKQAIEAKNWLSALDLFAQAAARDPGNADIHNYLGYANRKSGNLDAAFKSYAEALRLEPKHRAAHEYVGEAYLMVGNLAKAEEHLAALDKICLFSCEEYRDLKREIQEYKAKRATR